MGDSGEEVNMISNNYSSPDHGMMLQVHSVLPPGEFGRHPNVFGGPLLVFVVSHLVPLLVLEVVLEVVHMVVDIEADKVDTLE